ncbi:MAG: maleylpyruvate isomerase N-terminal domain-containing protein, partial [Chloroflexota bacterium]
MPELSAVPSCRADLQAELAATRAAVKRILAGMSDADWRRRSANPAWTVGAVLTHLTWSLKHVPREVEGARKGRGMYNLPAILAGPVNMLATRLLARRYTRRTIAQQYDAAYAAVLRTLEGVGDDEWRLGARFFG